MLAFCFETYICLKFWPLVVRVVLLLVILITAFHIAADGKKSSIFVTFYSNVQLDLKFE